MSKLDQFFTIFSFGHHMHDAIDGGIVYEQITILKDVITSNGFSLKAGTEYEAVWFLLDKQVFQFIDWKRPVDPSKDTTWNPDPQTFVEIPQKELAPFCKW